MSCHLDEMPKIFLRRLIYRAKSNKLKSFLAISFFICALFKYVTYRPVEYVPKHLHHYLRFSENYTYSGPSGPLELRALNDKLERWNAEREVHNWQAFGPVRADTTVLCVRAARDPERLQHLIVSLAQVDNIQSTIVIFSHSFFDERVDWLIKSINFCMVLQIYFPNSLQLFPNTFPGDDPGDCANANSDEEYCVDRDARLTETKHHWWWTAHVVFEDVAWARSHKGTVVFLEEDSYVLPDFLHMLRFAQDALRYIPEAEVLSFGRPLARNLDYDKLTVDTWRPPYDKGLAFNKTVWLKIKRLASHFCEYDDVSWGYSLLYAFEKSQDGRAVMVACMAPRVVSTGVFASGRRALESVWGTARSRRLFPAEVEAVVLFGREGRLYRRFRAPPRGNGGWSDVRDHMLCLDPMSSTVTEDDSTTTSPIFTTNKINVVN